MLSAKRLIKQGLSKWIEDNKSIIPEDRIKMILAQEDVIVKDPKKFNSDVTYEGYLVFQVDLVNKRIIQLTTFMSYDNQVSLESPYDLIAPEDINWEKVVPLDKLFNLD